MSETKCWEVNYGFFKEDDDNITEDEFIRFMDDLHEFARSKGFLCGGGFSPSEDDEED